MAQHEAAKRRAIRALRQWALEVGEPWTPTLDRAVTPRKPVPA